MFNKELQPTGNDYTQHELQHTLKIRNSNQQIDGTNKVIFGVVIDGDRYSQPQNWTSSQTNIHEITTGILS